MDRAAGSGLEIEPTTNLEVAIQPYIEKHYITGGAPNHSISSHLDTSNQSYGKVQSRFKTMWILAVIAFICLAIAIGAGLGVGLQHKSSTSR